MRTDHIIERAREHYGVEIDIADVGEMCRQCLEGRAVLVRRLEPKRGSQLRATHETRIVQIKDTLMVVVWFPGNREIATVCRAGHVTPQGRKMTAKTGPRRRAKRKLAERKMQAAIEAAMTEAGGWTKAQLAEWGVAWPPPHNWKMRLIQKAGDAA